MRPGARCRHEPRTAGDRPPASSGLGTAVQGAPAADRECAAIFASANARAPRRTAPVAERWDAEAAAGVPLPYRAARRPRHACAASALHNWSTSARACTARSEGDDVGISSSLYALRKQAPSNSRADASGSTSAPTAPARFADSR